MPIVLAAGCGPGMNSGGGDDMPAPQGDMPISSTGDMPISSKGDMPIPGDGDMAVIQEPDDMAVTVPGDMAQGDMVDMCLYLPLVTKDLPWNTDAGAFGMANCSDYCAPGRPDNYFGFTYCTLVTTDGGQVVECKYSACGFGRRPSGFEPGPVRATSEVGAWFARAAQLEAASVIAFRRLAEDLSELGAPRSLIGAARRSASDEERHARIMVALASRHGGEVAPFSVPIAGARDLEALATENATEGCVGETWGAIAAAWQAHHARHPAIRTALASIADDETRHAELSSSIADWAEPRLGEAARRRVDEARRAALAALSEQLGADPHPSLVAHAGLPSALDARGLFEEARRALFR